MGASIPSTGGGGDDVSRGGTNSIRVRSRGQEENVWRRPMKLSLHMKTEINPTRNTGATTNRGRGKKHGHKLKKKEGKVGGQEGGRNSRFRELRGKYSNLPTRHKNKTHCSPPSPSIYLHSVLATWLSSRGILPSPVHLFPWRRRE